jgi:four helix bundle protein
MPKARNSFDLEDRLIEFAVRVIKLVETLPKSNIGTHFSGQLIRCGTSPAPNYGEAQGAESRSDFIHKMKVCLKELRETKVWMKMIVRAELITPISKLDDLITENDQLIAIFVKSIETAHKNRESTIR